MAAMNPLGNIIDIHPAITPVDLSSGANNGDWISLENASGALVLFHSAVGTAGDDPTLNINQATDNSGTSSKDLSLSGAIYKKQAATDLTSTGTWSDASDDLSSGDWTNTDSAEQDTLVAVYIDANDLDVDNDFDHIQPTVADVGTNSQIGACYVILMGLSYPNSPDNVVSPL